MSEAGYENARKILDTQDEINARTRLLPVEVCQAVVNKIDSENEPCGLLSAHEFTMRLIRNYPDLKPHDGRGFILALDEVFAAYPARICAAVTDSNTGLPSRLNFNPRTANVKEALEAEVKRVDLVRANALWHMQEREHREKLKAAEAEYAHNKLSEEERRKQVEKLLKCRPIPSEPRHARTPADALGEPKLKPSFIDKDELMKCWEVDNAELEAKREARKSA